MKKKAFGLSLAVLGSMLLTAQMPSFAEEGENSEDFQGPYFTLGIGASFPNDTKSSDDSWGVKVTETQKHSGGIQGEVGAGYDFGLIRTELTYARSQGSTTDIDICVETLGCYGISGNRDFQSNSVFLSGYVDIPTKSKFSPYIGGGIGYTNIRTDAANIWIGGVDYYVDSASKGLFGYQAKAGATFAATQRLDVFAEATYRGTQSFKVGSTNVDPINAWGFNVGTRIKF